MHNVQNDLKGKIEKLVGKLPELRSDEDIKSYRKLTYPMIDLIKTWISQPENLEEIISNKKLNEKVLSFESYFFLKSIKNKLEVEVNRLSKLSDKYLDHGDYRSYKESITTYQDLVRFHSNLDSYLAERDEKFGLTYEVYIDIEQENEGKRLNVLVAQEKPTFKIIDYTSYKDLDFDEATDIVSHVMNRYQKIDLNMVSTGIGVGLKDALKQKHNYILKDIRDQKESERLEDAIFINKKSGLDTSELEQKLENKKRTTKEIQNKAYSFVFDNNSISSEFYDGIKHLDSKEKERIESELLEIKVQKNNGNMNISYTPLFALLTQREATK